VSWDPEQYLKYADERRRPAIDLLVRVTELAPPALATIVDLGCGAGNVTRLLAARWPSARITAIDSDRAMLDRAAAVTAEQIDWQHGDIAEWRASTAPELIFSNAALHWLPAHERLLPRLLAQLAVGGVLALQMPANFTAPSHQLLLDLASDPGWQAAFAGVRMGAVRSAAEYHDLLAPHCRQLEIWQTTYLHVLSGDDGLLDWMRGTTLRPYLARLDAQTTEHFLAAYRARLQAAYPRRPAGHTLFPFTRLFLLAQR